jgi:nucleoside-diphosphate-sugar epimerase
MNILVTGGCGYLGTILVEKLLKKNLNVVVIDRMWFGNFLKKNRRLRIIKDDFKNLNNYKLPNFNSIIHLANIANDPSAELSPSLSWEINVLGTEILMNYAKKNRIKKFLYASSGSVYGIKKERKVTENLELVPISLYNKTKMIAERIIASYSDQIDFYCIRPATICGYSPKMRLDVTVNLLTFNALQKGLMTIFGGKQIRPNIHIQDISNIFIHFLNKKLPSGFYNAGFENLSIIQIAKKIEKKVNTKIKIIKNTNDPRSYRQDSSKLLKTGFKPKFGVDYAIDELIENFNNKQLKEKKYFYTVKTMLNKKII